MTVVPKFVTSRDNPLLVRLRKSVGDAAGYRKLGQVWLEGDHLCRAYLARGFAPAHAVITEAGWDDAELRALASQAPAVTVISVALMGGLSTLESSPPIGFLVPWTAQVAIEAGQPSVVLDRVQDAGNVGTLLRSAAAFGFKQVVAVKGTAALWSPKVLRSAMGAHFGLHLVEGVSEQALSGLGVPMVATSSYASQSLPEADLPWPCAWVLGHEGRGVSETLMAQCSATVRIPQPGGEESLNVAAAAAICLYESRRRH